MLGQLEMALSRAGAGQGHVVLISGEASIGKSRLLQEFVQRSEDKALVLVGHSQPSEQALPYQPLAQALRQGLQTIGADLLAYHHIYASVHPQAMCTAP